MAFHQLLRDYINGGSASWLPFGNSKDATAVCLGFSYLGTMSGGEKITMDLKSYAGNHHDIIALRNYLQPLAGDLLSVILHGSVGDRRMTGYSDVDALVIIRNEVFNDPKRMNRVARRLSAARKFMYRFDPLQHHGWFVLAEQDLKCYPEIVLPLASLGDAVVLLGENKLNIYPQPSDPSLYEVAARRMTRKLIHQLQNGWRPSNAYQLKSLLSEFMMLPVLYLQALSGSGKSKRESFVSVQQAYDPSIWTIMDTVSGIRKDWQYSPDFLTKMVLFNASARFHPLRKRWPTRIPRNISPIITEKLFMDMLAFTEATELLLEAARR